MTAAMHDDDQAKGVDDTDTLSNELPDLEDQRALILAQAFGYNETDAFAEFGTPEEIRTMLLRSMAAEFLRVQEQLDTIGECLKMFGGLAAGIMGGNLTDDAGELAQASFRHGLCRPESRSWLVRRRFGIRG
ncbi:MAG: hypothetical protein O3C27_00030 [Actinomycetota bacterium]|nr:hypothetical protein [Actinomycetota bacterium]